MCYYNHMGSSTIDKKYIAGFFDGEGSAMIITIRRKMKTGIIYRFRPVARIMHKTPEVLFAIKDYLGYGHVTPTSKEGYVYVVNGLDGILQFVKTIAPHCFIKRDTLLVTSKLAEFQSSHQRNIPYTLEDTIKMLDIRDRVFELNKVTRTGLKQKYSREQVLAETTFISDVRQWQLKRAERGAIALEEAGKPYRFKKGENHASQ